MRYWKHTSQVLLAVVIKSLQYSNLGGEKNWSGVESSQAESIHVFFFPPACIQPDSHSVFRYSYMPLPPHLLLRASIIYDAAEVVFCLWPGLHQHVYNVGDEEDTEASVLLQLSNDLLGFQGESPEHGALRGEDGV